MANVPKQISKEAKSVFAALLKLFNDSAEDGRYLKIDNNKPDSGFMPLVMEKIQEGIKTPWGNTGYLLSLTHYYEQQGDLMKDPEVVFLVVDNRDCQEGGVFDLLGVWPQMFQQDGTIPMYQELMIIEDNTLKGFKEKWQRDAATFTAQWMKNLKWQQNILPIKEESPMRQGAGEIAPGPRETPTGLAAKFKLLKEIAKGMGYSSVTEAVNDGKEKELLDAAANRS